MFFNRLNGKSQFIFISLCVTFLGCAAQQRRIDDPLKFPASATLTKAELMDKIRGGWRWRAFLLSLRWPGVGGGFE
jgi:hypothetical protein